MTAVWMFPGQSACRGDMLRHAADLWPELTRHTLALVSDVLERDVRSWRRHIEVKGNQDVQLAVFVTSHVHMLALERAGHESRVSLGLSLGEYNHLVHIGALSFEDALSLVAARGAAYDAGPDGMMAAVFPLGADELEALIAQRGDVAIANLNSPTQQVVAGARAAVEAVLAEVERSTYAQAVIIERRLPMHSPLFETVARAFRPALEAAPWRRPRRPYWPNVTAEPIEEPGPATMVELLTRHVCEPVRWQQSIERVVSMHDDPVFVEVGPGRVLRGLLRRPWRTEPKVGTDDWDAALEVIRER